MTVNKLPADDATVYPQFFKTCGIELAIFFKELLVFLRFRFVIIHLTARTVFFKTVGFQFHKALSSKNVRGFKGGGIFFFPG